MASVLPLAISMIPSHAPAPHVTAPLAVCGIHCGTERWAIKTLSDPEAKDVVLTPKSATVSSLVAEAAPTTSSNDFRLNDLEKQAFRVKAKLVGFKQELSGGKGDHDFHIVIQDLLTADTMIIEIPDSACDGVCNSRVRAKIEKARSDFLAVVADNPPGSDFLVLDQPFPEVDVVGVGLFDFFHGQTGVATNCIELHPVLSIKFEHSGPFHAKKDNPGKPKKADKDDHDCIPE